MKKLLKAVWHYLFNKYLENQNRLLKNLTSIRWCETSVNLYEYSSCYKDFRYNVWSSSFTFNKASVTLTTKLMASSTSV